MSTPNREDLHLIGRITELPAESIQQALEEHVYRDKQEWRRFLPIFFLSLGIGFTVAGILFFFAYNWASLHKFVRIGLIEGLLVIATLAVLLSKLSPLVRKLILTGAAVLVGVLLAVFGQVYQTGADAYDLFLAWTLAIALWVAVAHFAPLWLLFILLCNITYYLYSLQTGAYGIELQRTTVLFLINLLFAVAGILLEHGKEAWRLSNWSVRIVTLAAAGWGTFSGILACTDDPTAGALVLFLGTFYPACAVGIWLGLQRRQLFYLCILPFSLIIQIAAWLLAQSSDTAMVLMVLIFVVASTCLLVWWLINLQKKYTHEKTC